jgi:hypothetical protein
MTQPAARPGGQHEPGLYEVRVRGHLDWSWTTQLGVPSLVHEADGTTRLVGISADQAALHGLLQRIRDLGLPLISVVRIDPEAPPT